MRYQHIIQAVFSEPWVITEAAHASVRRIVEAHLLSPAPRIEREATGICGDKVEVEQMQIAGGLAIIPVGGVLGNKLSSMERGAGAVDYMDIAREVRQADNDPNVKEIWFLFDSPGGTYNGCPETASKILNCQKMTRAVVTGQCCSGAYWLASQCNEIVATESSEIGSVGCYMAMLDMSMWAAMQGLKVDVFASGAYKGMGTPGTALTTDQQVHLKQWVNNITRDFKAAVTSYRDIPDECMQGQSMMAADALKCGMIDSIIPGLDDFMEGNGFNFDDFGSESEEGDAD